MQARETHRWDGQKAKSRFLSIFFLGIYNVEMHQNLYPFQSSMDAQRILCKRFQLVGFQSTGQNRQISALSRFSIAKKRNWTLGRFFFGGHPQTKSSKVTRGFYGLPAPARTLLGDAAERVGVQGGPKVGRLMGGGFFFVCFQDCLIHPTGPYPGIRIPIHPHQISEWILTQWWYNLHFL